MIDPTTVLLVVFAALTVLATFGLAALTKENSQLQVRKTVFLRECLRLSGRLEALWTKLGKAESDRWHLALAAGRSMQVFEEIQKLGGEPLTTELLAKIEATLKNLEAVEARVLDRVVKTGNPDKQKP